MAKIDLSPLEPNFIQRVVHKVRNALGWVVGLIPKPTSSETSLTGRVKLQEPALSRREWDKLQEELSEGVRNSSAPRDAEFRGSLIDLRTIYHDLPEDSSFRPRIGEMIIFKEDPVRYLIEKGRLHEAEKSVNLTETRKKFPDSISQNPKVLKPFDELLAERGDADALIRLATYARDLGSVKEERKLLMKAYKMKHPIAAHRLSDLEAKESKRRKYLIDAELFSKEGGFVTADFVERLSFEAKKGLIFSKKLLEVLSLKDSKAGYQACLELFRLTGKGEFLERAIEGNEMNAFLERFARTENLEDLKAAADLGSREACAYFAFSQGDESYLEKAAKLGEPSALFVVARRAYEEEPSFHSLNQIVRAAYAGSAGAASYLGNHYLKEGEREKGIDYLEMGVQLGSHEAMERLGLEIYNEDEERAVQLLKLSLTPTASKFLGEHLIRKEQYDAAFPYLLIAGRGGLDVRDPIKRVAASASSLNTLEEARDLVVEGIERVDELIELGKNDLKLNHERARRSFERALELGSSEAALLLGEYYKSRDIELSADYFLTALQLGVADEKRTRLEADLSVLRFLGSVEAKLYFNYPDEVADLADQGEPRASLLHAKRLISAGLEKEGRCYLYLAAISGIPEAMLLLGQMFLEEDTVFALQLFYPLAEAGNPVALYEVGRADNNRKALEEAARLGEPRALYDLGDKESALKLGEPRALFDRSEREENPFLKAALLRQVLKRVKENEPLYEKAAHALVEIAKSEQGEARRSALSALKEAPDEAKIAEWSIEAQSDDAAVAGRALFSLYQMESPGPLADQLLREAADRGNVDALIAFLSNYQGTEEQMDALSLLLSKAKPKDADQIYQIVKAIEKYQKGSDPLPVEEGFLLAAILGSEEAFKETIGKSIKEGRPFSEYGKQLEESESPLAMRELAKFYDSEFAEGVYATGEKDDGRAFQVYEKLAAGGNQSALESMIRMMMKGRGCECNLLEAYQLAEKNNLKNLSQEVLDSALKLSETYLLVVAELYRKIEPVIAATFLLQASKKEELSQEAYQKYNDWGFSDKPEFLPFTAEMLSTSFS